LINQFIEGGDMKKIWIVNMLALMVVFVSAASAEFYRYTDPHGNPIYTDDLSKVPEAQRSKATMYEESISKKTPPDNAETPPAQQPANEMDTLKSEGQRLIAVKAQLDKEYNELAAENTKLKAEQKEAVTPDQVKSVNKKVVSFNTRFQAYQEKSAAYQADVETYNKRVRLAESKAEPGQNGQSQ
jgi:hypothetical protein